MPHLWGRLLVRPPVRTDTFRLCCLFAVAISVLSTAAWSKPIEGNKVVVTQRRPGGPFTSVRSTGMEQHWIGDCKQFHVRVRFGHTSKMLVTGERNILPYLRTTVENGQLEVSLKGYVKPTKPIVVVATSQTPNVSMQALGDNGPKIEGLACSMGFTMGFPGSPNRQN